MLHNNPKETKLTQPPETLQLSLASLSQIPPQKSIFEEETERRNHLSRRVHVFIKTDWSGTCTHTHTHPRNSFQRDFMPKFPLIATAVPTMGTFLMTTPAASRHWPTIGVCVASPGAGQQEDSWAPGTARTTVGRMPASGRGRLTELVLSAVL